MRSVRTGLERLRPWSRAVDRSTACAFKLVYSQALRRSLADLPSNSSAGPPITGWGGTKHRKTLSATLPLPPCPALMTRTSLKKDTPGDAFCGTLGIRWMKDEEKLGNQLWSVLAPSSGFLRFRIWKCREVALKVTPSLSFHPLWLSERPFSDPNSTFTPVLRTLVAF